MKTDVNGCNGAILFYKFVFKFNEHIYDIFKDVHIVVPFAYLLLSYSKFEWAENAAVQARTKKLSGKQICCTTKWFL